MSLLLQPTRRLLHLHLHHLTKPTIATTTKPTITRTFTTTPAPRSEDENRPAFAFNRGPAPPRLPKEQQEIFEELQRNSTGAFSTPRVNQSPDASPASTAEIKATGKGEELHPDIKTGLKPEFEGEKNPKTGEIGGPKNEPLRWGAGGDWSYGGRVTDF